MNRSPNQLKVTRRAGCMRDGSPVHPLEIPATVRETLRMIAEGYGRMEIAVERRYSVEAIARHITALLVVYDARNTNHLVALAVRAGHV